MNRPIGRKYRAAVLLLALLTGCGNAGTAAPEGQSPSSVPRQEQDAVYNLLEEKWAEERRDVEASTWNVADCVEVSLADEGSADASYYFSAVEGSRYYVLQDLLTRQGEQYDHALYWVTTDVVSGESIMEQWTLQASPKAEEEAESGTESQARTQIDSLIEAFEDNRAWITGMDVQGGKVYLFFQQSESRETACYFQVQADREGHVEKLLDLLPALQEGGIHPQENMQLPGGRCDGAGRCYVGDGAMSRVSVIDRDGSLLTVLEGEAGDSLAYIGKLPDGSPLYACGNSREQRLVILGCDGQRQKELYRGEYALLQQCLIRPGGDLIYGESGRLLRWNVMQGVCESLYDDRNLNFAGCDGILEGEGGELFAAFCREGGTFLYGFTDREMETVVIRLEMLGWGGDYLQTCASEYGRSHPGVVIEVTGPEEDTEQQLIRTMASLSQGEGPELLLVRRQQLQALQEAGALAELSEVLPVGEQEQIFPGALENGRIGDGLYGITYSTTLSTLLVSGRMWEGKSWSLGEVIKLLEEEPIVERFSSLAASDRAAANILYDLALANIGHSSLVDLQAEKCCFDAGEFEKVLEICKRYGQAAQNSPRLTEEEMAELLQEGKILVHKAEGNLIQFSRALALLGGDFHVVGYPTESGMGSLMMGYGGCVAVNADAGHREIIDDFLRFLVGYKAQRQYGTDWVRMDVLKDSVRETVEVYGYDVPVPVFQTGEGVTVLMGKQDGSSYLSEFLEAVGDARPYEAELDQIRNLVREEADAYFAGDKGLQETVGIIQSRVQLYLDESR